ncbi:hypothetical protein C5B42_04425, partial [Candidatus Cerribacteria bacterium 'Amazon FNV 2010 28 9']
YVQPQSPPTVTPIPVVNNPPTNPPPANTTDASRCWVDLFDISPNPPYQGGILLTIHGRSSRCDNGHLPRAYKFTQNGSQWGDEEQGGEGTIQMILLYDGNYQICFLVASEGDNTWSYTPPECKTVQVGTGNSPQPQGTWQPPTDGASCPQARQKDRNGNLTGGFDIITVAYCWGYGNAHNDTGKWDGWVMDGNGKTPLNLGPGNFDSLCQAVYGSGWTAYHKGDGAGDIICDYTMGEGNFWGCGYGTSCTTSVPQPTIPPNVPKPSGGTTVCPDAPTSIMVGITHGRSTLGGAPLKLHSSPGGSQIGTIQNGQEFDIIDGPQCANQTVWWKIKTSNGNIGWVAEGDTTSQYIEPYGTQPQPQIGDVLTCDGLADNNSDGGGIIPKAYAAEPPQCTDYVRSVYTQLRHYCPTVAGAAGGWADLARAANCGLSVNPQQSGGIPNRYDIQVGDIVVWAPQCGQTKEQAGDSGHVAIVTSVALDTQGDGPGYMDRITVEEANWNGSTAAHTSRTLLVDICLSFIHVPSYMH